MKRRLYFITTLLLLLLALRPAPLQAQQGLIMEIKPGFDAFFKPDSWGVVRVTVANQGPDLQAELQFRERNSRNGATIYAYPVDLPSQSRKQLALNLPTPRRANIVVNLVDGAGETLLSQQANIELLDQEDFLVGVVASDPSLLNALAGLNTPNGNRVAVAHLDLADLPAASPAWSSLDMLVFNDVDTTQLSPAQQEALRHWVSFGGRLVIGGGPNGAQTIAGLKPLLPFAEVVVDTLPHPLADLEKFTRNSLPDRGPYVAAIPTQPTGQVVIREGNQPLLVSGDYGLGQAHYLALDLGLAPLDVLAGQQRFLPRIVGRFEPRHKLALEQVNGGEMFNSLALIPDQTLPKPGAIALYLMIYVLTIGPANYFVLSRLKRREWAWFSLPLIILLFCGFGYFSGFRLRGGRPILRQITILHTTAASPMATIDSYIGIYSPQRTKYELEVEGTALVRPLSNDSLNSELNIIAAGSTRVENLQADIGGMPAVLARSQTASPQIQTNVSYNQSTHRFKGAIVNGTGQPIDQAHLIFEDRVLDLGTLPPGETVVDGLANTYYVYNNIYNMTNIGPNTPEAIELVSRDIALRAVLGYNNYYANNGSNLDNLYLTGWQAGSPLSITLPGRSSDNMNETLLLVSLPITK